MTAPSAVDTPRYNFNVSDMARTLLKLDLIVFGAFAPAIDRCVAAERRFAYYGGTLRDGAGGITVVPDGSIVCPDNEVNYVQLDSTTGDITVSPTAPAGLILLAQVTCLSGQLTHVEDLRDVNLVSGGSLSELILPDAYDGPGFGWRVRVDDNILRFLDDTTDTPRLLLTDTDRLVLGEHGADQPVVVDGIVNIGNIIDGTTGGGAQFTGFGRVEGAAGGIRYNCWAYRGSVDAPEALAANDRMFRIVGFGHDGTNWNTIGQPRVMIRFSAAEDWTTTAQGTYIDFFVTEPGTLTARQPVRLAGHGPIFIGTRHIFTPNIAYETPFPADASMVHFLGQGSGVGQGATIRHLVAGAIPALATGRANGTFAAPTALAANDIFASYVFTGHDGSGWTGSRAQIRAVATEDWEPGAHGSKLQFRVTRTATASVVTAAEVHADGLEVFDNGAEPAAPATNNATVYAEGGSMFMKRDDGGTRALGLFSVGPTPPNNPRAGDVWLDTGSGS